MRAIESLKDFFNPRNVFERCRLWGVPLWQCPDMIMVFVGALAVTTIILVTLLSQQYQFTEEVLVIVASALAVAFLVAGFLLSVTLEKIAQANHLRAQFLRIVSHQLRSPITAARWALSSLASDVAPTLPESAARMIAIAEDAIGRMRRVAEAVAEVSVAARMQRPQEVFAVQGVLESLSQEFSSAARIAGIPFVSRLEAKTCLIRADRDQIRYVVEVLLDNAMRYSKKGDTVSLGLSCEAKNAVISVHDTGMGIPQKEQKKMFEPFFRTSAAHGMWPGGTGLSLFAAYSIVQAFGGKLSFASQEKRGTTFAITVPRISEKP